MTADNASVKLAYADPPYLGCSQYYGHPDAKKWDKPSAHLDLMATLEDEYEGWALSCSSPMLRHLVPAMPEGARVAAWVKSGAQGSPALRVGYIWEPVIFRPARPYDRVGGPWTIDGLAAPAPRKAASSFVGSKPVPFCRWVLAVLGYRPGDEVVDLFPGTAIMDRVLAQGSFAV